MSGYRQSNYDPDAYQRMGRPLRPFNGWQWAGVVFGIVGLAIYLVDIAGRIGWIPPLIPSPLAGVGLLLAGSVLVNSRREPSADITPEQHAANRRSLIITAIICAAIFGTALVIEFTGA